MINQSCNIIWTFFLLHRYRFKVIIWCLQSWWLSIHWKKTIFLSNIMLLSDLPYCLISVSICPSKCVQLSLRSLSHFFSNASISTFFSYTGMCHKWKNTQDLCATDFILWQNYNNYNSIKGPFLEYRDSWVPMRPTFYLENLPLWSTEFYKKLGAKVLK
jgi:hypothetical protein